MCRFQLGLGGRSQITSKKHKKSPQRPSTLHNRIDPPPVSDATRSDADMDMDMGIGVVHCSLRLARLTELYIADLQQYRFVAREDR